MNPPLLSRNLYIFLFSLLGIVYITGLFVPLMDNDSAHHANIALRMYLTGDYVTLADYAGNYLDKPHLHFWLCAWSYKIFGVTGFAYKLPSFLFTILGTYSTFRIGKALYNAATGRLAALMLASAFAYILANNDVRMDAILTASIAFATWQLLALIQDQKIINVAGAALGLALGFCTKGHIAVFVPAVAVFFYLLYQQQWKVLLHWKWLLLPVLFGLFISPVVYCYYLQYNLHPEIMVRGKDHLNGVKFILFNQSIERFQGDSFGGDSKHDYFFFLHSFLWAFAPWSILAYVAVVNGIKKGWQRRQEWLTTGVFLVLLLLVSFSGFKLPHYLNIVFPTTAVLTAAMMMSQAGNAKIVQRIYLLQLVTGILLIVLVSGLMIWAFPIRHLWVIVLLVFFLAVYFYFLRSTVYTKLQKAVCSSVAAMAFCFFLLNANFYPQLLTYQGGNELAFAIRGKVDPARVYCWDKTVSSSFNFYTKTLRQPFTDSVIGKGKKTWLLFDVRDEAAIRAAGYQLGDRFETTDYEITRLKGSFVNPATREAHCTKLVLAELSR